MPLSIPRSLVEYLLLGTTRDRRHLQDSPILLDVWSAFGEKPEAAHEVLIKPDWHQTTHGVAADLDKKLDDYRQALGESAAQWQPADIAYLEDVIAARLHFDELLHVVVPMTLWWHNESAARAGQAGRLAEVTRCLADAAANWAGAGEGGQTLASALDRFTALAGLILWAAEVERSPDAAADKAEIAEAIRGGTGDMRKRLAGIFPRPPARARPGAKRKPAPVAEAEPGILIYEVSLNRPASLAIAKSVGSVKGDAARNLFKIHCSGIGWAVIDVGIKGDHPAFLDGEGKSRVKQSFDFSRYRKIVSFDNRRIFAPGGDKAKQKERLAEVRPKTLRKKLTDGEAMDKLHALGDDMANKRPLRWDLVEPFVEIGIESDVANSDHGTHVAGIIGAGELPEKAKVPKDQRDEYVPGMCPDIKLYDFRVIAESDDVRDTEFAIIAALQYIRYLNESRDFITIHGANLSLSIPHNVENFACGRTPICDACEKLIDSGVVVVAAAGNLGYQKYETKDGLYESYAASSITDPGNADGVITVGSTHRTAPHTYGISFFSSRGPTGDGRQKPDIVAPGEKIHAPFRVGWGDLDGTSMAAPHVSGAAALLLARYPEMMGQPRRIKRILCETATDLERERSFQGHGMLDVLRALQSI